MRTKNSRRFFFLNESHFIQFTIVAKYLNRLLSLLFNCHSIYLDYLQSPTSVSSPGLLGQVSFSRRRSSVLLVGFKRPCNWLAIKPSHDRPLTFIKINFSSKTTGPNITTLSHNNGWGIEFQNCDRWHRPALLSTLPPWLNI